MEQNCLLCLRFNRPGNPMWLITWTIMKVKHIPQYARPLASFLLNQPKPAKLSFKTIRQLIQKCVPKAPVSTDRMYSSNHIQTDVSYVRFSCDKDWVLSIIYPFTNCVPHTLFNKLFFSPLVFPRHESPKPNFTEKWSLGFDFVYATSASNNQIHQDNPTQFFLDQF